MSDITTLVITGGLGNLGSKLCNHLLTTSSKYKVILIEHPNFCNNKPLPHSNATLLPCNLGNPTSEQHAALKLALEKADTLIHFSAVNPYPNASWSECAQSMDHSFYIFQLAVLCKGEWCMVSREENDDCVCIYYCSFAIIYVRCLTILCCQTTICCILFNMHKHTNYSGGPFLLQCDAHHLCSYAKKY